MHEWSNPRLLAVVQHDFTPRVEDVDTQVMPDADGESVACMNELGVGEVSLDTFVGGEKRTFILHEPTTQFQSVITNPYFDASERT